MTPDLYIFPALDGGLFYKGCSSVLGYRAVDGYLPPESSVQQLLDILHTLGPTVTVHYIKPKVSHHEESTTRPGETESPRSDQHSENEK